VAQGEKEETQCKEKLERDIEAAQLAYDKELMKLKLCLAKTAADLHRELTSADYGFLDGFVLKDSLVSSFDSQSEGSSKGKARTPDSRRKRIETELIPSPRTPRVRPPR
jgi:hypothetical protein